MKKLTMSEKIDLIKASDTVAKFWKVTPSDMLALVALGNRNKQAKWNKIVKEVKDFSKLDIKGKAKALGFTIEEKNETKN